MGQESSTKEHRFTLPCGCVAASHASGNDFSVEWCPHHKNLHGVVAFEAFRGTVDTREVVSPRRTRG